MPNLLDGSYKTVSLEQAQAAIRNYREFISSNNISNPVNGFLIVHADIVQALELQGEFPRTSYERFRAYLGLTDPANPPATENFSPWHLYVVPVDMNGDDVIPYVAGKPVVYDFDAPCPTTCDPNSPLFNV